MPPVSQINQNMLRCSLKNPCDPFQNPSCQPSTTPWFLQKKILDVQCTLNKTKTKTRLDIYAICIRLQLVFLYTVIYKEEFSIIYQHTAEKHYNHSVSAWVRRRSAGNLAETLQSNSELGRRLADLARTPPSCRELAVFFREFLAILPTLT
jgi:hypothetical protein